MKLQVSIETVYFLVEGPDYCYLQDYDVCSYNQPMAKRLVGGLECLRCLMPEFQITSPHHIYPPRYLIHFGCKQILEYFYLLAIAFILITTLIGLQ